MSADNQPSPDLVSQPAACFCAPRPGEAREIAFKRAISSLSREHLIALVLLEARRRATLPGHQCYLDHPDLCPYNPYPRAAENAANDDTELL